MRGARIGEIWGLSVPCHIADTYQGMLDELREQINQIHYQCELWESGRLSNDSFLIAALATQQQYQGIPAEVWERDEDAARAFVQNHNEAMKHMLAVFDAIAVIKHAGHRGIAPDSIRHEALKVVGDKSLYPAARFALPPSPPTPS